MTEQNTSNKILAAARDLLERDGADAVSMRRLARGDARRFPQDFHAAVRPRSRQGPRIHRLSWAHLNAKQLWTTVT